jgi:gamma-butyrobetaine dioxygenase
MKIELSENKVFFENDGSKKEIHPFWLRERVNGDQYVDQGTQQRLFDPTELKNNIKINKLLILDDFLEVTFDDGAFAKIAIQNILKEFADDNDIKLIEKIKWNSSLKDFNYFQFNENFFENKSMFDALIKFYQYGFVIFKNVPTENNFLIKFANSIGSIRRTNFGEYFDVKSKPNPNDLAYTSLPLAPHTDNPYRNPVPCIQILHCIENEVSGGFSTLVDGYTVTEELKKNYKEYYEVLTKTKIRFQFIDKSVVLESWAEMIQLDEYKKFKQVRFSPRLDFVPLMDRDKLELYYSARNKISELYNSDQYRIEFKLSPGDLLMMDNHRLLHGRTTYDANEGNRFLQGCYIDYDSTEGKLKHLQRKFNN